MVTDFEKGENIDLFDSIMQHTIFLTMVFKEKPRDVNYVHRWIHFVSQSKVLCLLKCIKIEIALSIYAICVYIF